MLLAELLGLPHATIIMQIEVQDGRMQLKRELEAGWFQWVELPLPAVLTIQSGINKVRYATLKGIMAAKKKEIVDDPARIAGRRARADAARRAHLRAAKDQEDRIHHRHAERSRREAARKIEARSARAVSATQHTDMNILLITEQRDGKWNTTSFETLAAAQQIAAADAEPPRRAWSSAKACARWPTNLPRTKLDEVLLVEHELLDAYTPDGFTIALQQVIAQAKPDLVLLPHTYQVRDFAPKLAASLGKGMIGDCIGYRYENGQLIFVRQMFQGKTAADVTFRRRRRRGSPRFRPARFAPIWPRAAPSPRAGHVRSPSS